MPNKRIVLIGRSLQHSKSPVMQNAAFRHSKLPFHYEVIDVEQEQLETTILRLKQSDFHGANVTIPYKEKVMQFLDHITPAAQKIGAVNTIFVEDGLLIGDNTDGEGYLRSLLEEFPNLPFRKMTVAIIGAGGAAKAIAVTLANRGLRKLYIANRSYEHGMKLAKQVKDWTDVETVTIDQFQSQLRHVDLLIQCTPVGMYPHIDDSILPKHVLYPGLIVSDIIYNPTETKLLKDAKEKGALTHNGVGMLVYQGALAFERWTKCDAPIEVMRQALLSSLSLETRS